MALESVAVTGRSISTELTQSVDNMCNQQALATVDIHTHTHTV